MGAAYYEDLAGRLYGLLIMLEDRLGGEQSQLLYHFNRSGRVPPGAEGHRWRARPGQDRRHRPGARRHAGPGPQDEDGRSRAERAGALPAS